MVKIVENILDYLKKKHLLWTVKLEPMLVGIHPCNRDGYGVNPQDVLDLIDSIVDVGFVKGKVHAVGVEVESDEVRRWNERLLRLGERPARPATAGSSENHEHLRESYECCSAAVQRPSGSQQRARHHRRPTQHRAVEAPRPGFRRCCSRWSDMGM